MGVTVQEDGEVLYEHAAGVRRVATSLEKLLLSMALFDRLGTDARIATTAAATDVRGSVIPGDLWIRGNGDPTVSDRDGALRLLPLSATTIGSLARRIRAAGVRRIEGSVLGSRDYFLHDWHAPGWRPDFRAYQVALPSALTFNENTYRGRHIADPERRSAEALTLRLRSMGVAVRGTAGEGRAPPGLLEIARVDSAPLWTIVEHMNAESSNFFAEVLGKLLAVERYGQPGTIAKGALASREWARERGAHIDAYDSSGLSYLNRISPRALSRLLDLAEEEAWGALLRTSLPSPGEGTLERRLRGVPVRAKTGTLARRSGLAGWVWLRRRGQWASFSILSKGLDKTQARAIEDLIVKTISRWAS